MFPGLYTGKYTTGPQWSWVSNCGALSACPDPVLGDLALLIPPNPHNSVRQGLCPFPGKKPRLRESSNHWPESMLVKGLLWTAILQAGAIATFLTCFISFSHFSFFFLLSNICKILLVNKYRPKSSCCMTCLCANVPDF